MECNTQNKNDSLIAELLQCAICLGQLSDARILPCCHSFCESCLQTHMQTALYNNPRLLSTFPCPSCRISIRTPTNGIDGFLKDFRLTKFTDVLKTISEQKEEKVCGICAVDNLKAAATLFCAECEKHFCMQCAGRHGINTAFADHHMLNLFKNEVDVKNSCSKHATQEAKFMCTTCDIKLCVVCVLKEHNNHQVLSQAGHLSAQRMDLHKHQTDLGAMIWNIHHKLFQLTCLEGELKGKYEESCIEIKKRSAKLINKIRSDENKIMRFLNDEFTKKCDQLLQLREDYREHLVSYETLQTHIICVLQESESSEIQAQYSHILKEIQKLGTSHKERLQTNELHKFIHFFPGNKLKFGKLKAIDLNQKIERYSEDSPQLDSVDAFPRQSSTGNSFFPISQRDRQQLILHTELVSIFGGFGHNDGDLSLPYNICFTADGNILVAENGNRRLQLFNKEGKTMCTIAAGEIIPRGVIMIRDNICAITDEQTKSLKVYNINGRLLKTLVPPAATLPYGLATTQNGEFIFTDMIFENVTIMNEKGKLLTQFGSHGSSMFMFNNPGYIECDNDDNIFVSDSGNHSIKIFNTAGNFILKFGTYGKQEGQLCYPKAVVSDNNGRIFVADSGNDRVAVYSTIGQFLQILVTKSHGLLRPTGLAYHQTGFLAVSMPDINEVRIYKVT